MTFRPTNRARRLRAFCAAALACLAASVVLAAPVLDEDHLVILEARLGRTVLSPGLLAYVHGDGVLLPLGELTDLLEFALDVDPASGRAAGWFLDESRAFSLDLAGGRVSSGDYAGAVGPEEAAANIDDIYVDARQLALWFPLDLDVRVTQLVVLLTGREVMPVEKRLRREELRERRLAAEAGPRSVFPTVKADYQLFTWPLTDVSLEYRGRGEERTPRASLQSVGDLGWLSTHVFATHQDGSRLVEAARVRAGRSDADAELLGPLHATEFEFGDLYTPTSPLVARGGVGRGFQLSNRTLRRSDRFDRTTIEGDAPPGWEVELHVNGALHDFGNADENGRYLFEDVPVAFGRNEFRTVLYGPQGQTREHVETVQVGAEMIEPGRLAYRVGAAQTGRFLITGDDLLAADADRGLWASHAELGFGLSRRLSLLAGLTRQPVEGVHHVYRSLTANSVLRGLHLQAVAAADADGGSALALGAQGSLGGRSLQLRHERFDDFVSDANEVWTQRTSETLLRLGGAVRPGGRHFAYDLNLNTTSYTGRGITREDDVALRLATALRSFSWTGRLDYRNSVSTVGDHRTLFLDQLVSGQRGRLLLRGNLRTGFSPDFGLEQAGLSAATNLSHDLRVGLRAQHNFAGDGSTTLGASLTLLLDHFQVGLNTYDADGQDRYFGLTVSTALTRIPENRRVHVQRSRMSAGYGATARVFLDRNANGLWDDQDDPLPGIRFAGSGQWRDVATDPSGIAYLANLPPHTERAVRLDLESLEDPYLLPSLDGISATGHAGAHLELQFPVTFAGDVEGTVYARTPTGRIPLRNIGVELVDMRRHTSRTVVSEFDGYYLFQEVPPGWYELRVVERTLQRKNLRMPPPLAVIVPASGGVEAGNDFQLRFVEEQHAER